MAGYLAHRVLKRNADPQHLLLFGERGQWSGDCKSG